MRFVLNLIGGVLLAFALVFAVADISRSLADGALRLSSLSEGFAFLGLQPAGQEGPSANAVDLIGTILAWPASILLGLAAFILLFVGRPPRRRGRLAR